MGISRLSRGRTSISYFYRNHNPMPRSCSSSRFSWAFSPLSRTWFPSTLQCTRALQFSTDVSTGEASNGKEGARKAARQLISRAKGRCNTSIDSPLPKPALELSSQEEKGAIVTNARKVYLNVDKWKGDWICRKCNFMNFAKNLQCLSCKEEMPKRSNEVTMKKGDWTCGKCNFMNFARNLMCIQCREHRPQKTNSDDVQMRDGDWTCRRCDFMNFAKNFQCLRCKENRPWRGGVHEIEMKKGDWNCPRCKFMNFARNSTCRHCQTARPRLLIGEWECPSCDFLNYRGNMKCLKCNSECPEDIKELYGDPTWRTPKAAAPMRDSDSSESDDELSPLPLRDSDSSESDDELSPAQRS